MKVTIIGKHGVDGVAPGGTIDVPEDRARTLAKQGHISWDDLKPPAERHICDVCEFEAKSAGGLTTHAKTHEAD